MNISKPEWCFWKLHFRRGVKQQISIEFSDSIFDLNHLHINVYTYVSIHNNILSMIFQDENSAAKVNIFHYHYYYAYHTAQLIRNISIYRRYSRVHRMENDPNRMHTFIAASRRAIVNTNNNIVCVCIV